MSKSPHSLRGRAKSRSDCEPANGRPAEQDEKTTRLPRLISSRMVCMTCNWSYHWFSRWKKVLMKHYEFPAPVGLPGHPRWARDEVLTWLNRLEHQGIEIGTLPQNWADKIEKRMGATQ